ncbi:hypothetical protein HMPREF9248_1183 [Fannyhessea vaginae PB189-T1-4]|uniref:Uncharacterized protein n=1 Tax=Fannyhessea vaginae PB189-T1-4 TaxID=866774 RepID=A0ABN0B157_9ACTN|nr:hypothetical protein HMPREF9248_1183 [Fannyhessea vaginae PB189-T1-4]
MRDAHENAVNYRRFAANMQKAERTHALNLQQAQRVHVKRTGA